MGMPQLIVTAVLVEGRSKSEVARDYRVSRRWVITLVGPYLAEGEAGLQPRSRRPLRSPAQTPVEVEEQIVAIRKELDRDRHDAGAETIAFHLQQRHGHTPSVSTIWRVLKARGFLTPQPHKRPKSAGTRFQAAQPNEMWAMDTTHWRLADGTDVEILNALDDHSRLVLISTARTTFTGPEVDRSFRRATCHHGNAAVLTDNGAIFTGLARCGGRVTLEKTLQARGIRPVRTRAYHPQTNGKVERFHQSLKKWLRGQPPAATLRHLQQQLDTFRSYYNTVRPHRALNRRTPATAYAARPKATPTGAIIDTAHWRTRQDKIDRSGVVTLRHNSRLHHIGLGRRHAGTHVLILAKDRNIRVIATNTGALLRELELNPEKDYQPQAHTVNDVAGHL
jgi:transposase InsO family protein